MTPNNAKQPTQARTESEAELENALITQLVKLGYAKVTVENNDQLKANLKTQLEVHNELTHAPLSDAEFTKVLNHLEKGNVFAKAHTLRDKFQFTRDDGSTLYLEFLNSQEWCKNQYQVTHQFEQTGDYKNRYDVTLLVNGLPLVQIELKRRGGELKEAFNQINRYQRHSFWSNNALFQYVQLFVISNGENTKYYANNRKQSFAHTFFWAKEDNSIINQLDAFTDEFLEPCHVSKMICQYIVLNQSLKIAMILRPYQYYAAEAIVNQVKHQPQKNGYIWHTTGSGKTLTSFKAAQILTKLPKVHKVLFVVDRADLDYQTAKEFNAFSNGCVDETKNTQILVDQLKGEHAGGHSLVVTTIQKLNNAVKNERYKNELADIQDKRVVLIFDECHRSQFGDSHKLITQFFTRAQLFGFTGTPIFKDNSTRNEHGRRTTEDLFGKPLHKYVITNAIADGNVLRFAIEYWGKLKAKDGKMTDEDVSAINKKEFFENPKRISDIVDWIIAHHANKTHQKDFSAMLAVSSVDALKLYYQAFAEKKADGKHDLRVVTIFTYQANEDDAEADGGIAEPNMDGFGDTEDIKADPKKQHSRDVLASYVTDYNVLYGTNHHIKDSKGFYAYYKDIAKRMKEREKDSFLDKDRADILLVVNMYLTGFDAKKLNTMYVDKNLRQHGLIQAFSRTNRVLNAKKSHGNIVCFRNLKDATDDAIRMFSDLDADKEKVLLEPYETYVARFNAGVETLQNIAPTPDAVNELKDEELILMFVQAFRVLMRNMNVLKPFSQFSWEDLALDAQTYENYKSKYLDISDSIKNPTSEGESVSILDEVDFELELIHRDEVNVSYILKLLAQLKREQAEAQSNNGHDSKSADEQAQKQLDDVLKLIETEPKLRSKKELIAQFIEDNLAKIDDDEDIENAFYAFLDEQKAEKVTALCEQENLDETGLKSLLEKYHFTRKPPLREDIMDILTIKPKLMERKKIYERVLDEVNRIMEVFT